MKRRFGIAYALVLFAGPTSVVAAPNPIEIQEPGTNLFAEKKGSNMLSRCMYRGALRAASIGPFLQRMDKFSRAVAVSKPWPAKVLGQPW